MPSCEKCWSDAHTPETVWYGGVAERYGELIEARNDNPCTPEQQAGPDAGLCPSCDRRTAHQRCGVCMVCGHDPSAKQGENAK